MKNVVIVESPAKAKTINKYLGNDYVVLASYGHIRDLPPKEGSVIPDNDFEMKWLMSPSGKKRMSDIESELKDADTLILATDPDREGEAISWHIIQELTNKKKLKDKTIQRVTFNEITKTAVDIAFKAPRELDDNLINSYMTRRALDYLVGFTLSPVLWRKLPGAKSAGRVQSVALRLICEREAEIEIFKPKEYWSLSVPFKKDGIEFNANLKELNGEKQEKFSITNVNDADKASDVIGNGDFKVIDIAEKDVKKNPYPPFTTSTLQQEASKKLYFSPSKTMQIAQKLYEGFNINGEQTGLITYMRTDGITIANDAVAKIRETISSVFGDENLPDSPRMYKSKAKNAQEAHEAIRPTDISLNPKGLSSVLDKDELALYELIWKRTIACQMKSAVVSLTSVDIENSNNTAKLRATGSVTKFQGFLSVYSEEIDEDKETDTEENNKLPAIAKGETLKPVDKTIQKQSFTSPPPRYSEATIIKTLEEYGIGRPSTYTSILKVLLDREYVTLDKRRFFANDRGRIVTTFLSLYFNDYFNYDFTANLEESLDKISNGDEKWKEVLNKFWKNFSLITTATMDINPADIREEIDKDLGGHFFPTEESRKCPSCNDNSLGLNFGKYGAYVACKKYPDCNFSRQLEKPNEATGDLYPKLLGELDGLDLSLKKGPYGFYIELATEPKVKRIQLPKNIAPEDLALDTAIKLISLPREIGVYSETNEMITGAIGRFGPFLKVGADFISLPSSEDVLEIGINKAVEVVAAGLEKKKANAPTPVGMHPTLEAEITVQAGRYGPYVKCLKTNAPIPKGIEMKDITLEQAIEAIDKQLAKKPAKKAKAKKSSAKKASAKKAKAKKS
ncbi:MAG: type I DNA topoisomerase [Alphaproteobacteria bacterium]